MFCKPGVSRVISPRPGNRQDDEAFTRKVHRYFALTILILAAACGAKQYFGTPISCWTTGHMTGSQAKYAETSCYFSDTISLLGEKNNAEPIQNHDEQVLEKSTNYYKWTPIVLAFFAILYLIPEIILTFGGKLFRFNFDKVIEIARQSHNGSRESREAAIEQLVVDLQSRTSDTVSRAKRTDFRRWIDKMTPSLPFFIRLQYLSSKIVLALAAIFPLILLRYFLYLNFGFNDQIMTRNNSAVRSETLFPKHIMCEMVIRQFSNVQLYTIQCDLPSNDMFEKISILVGFLAFVVCINSIGDVISCMVAGLFGHWDYPYIKRRMELINNFHSGYDTDLLRDFVERYLKSDVIYLLQLIGQNSSEHVVCQILARLWSGYVERLFNDRTKRPSSQDGKNLLETKDNLQNDILPGDIHMMYSKHM